MASDIFRFILCAAWHWLTGLQALFATLIINDFALKTPRNENPACGFDAFFGGWKSHQGEFIIIQPDYLSLQYAEASLWPVNGNTVSKQENVMGYRETKRHFIISFACSSGLISLQLLVFSGRVFFSSARDKRKHGTKDLWCESVRHKTAWERKRNKPFAVWSYFTSFCPNSVPLPFVHSPCTALWMRCGSGLSSLVVPWWMYLCCSTSLLIEVQLNTLKTKKQNPFRHCVLCYLSLLSYFEMSSVFCI